MPNNPPSVEIFIHDMPVVNDLSYYGFYDEKYLIKTCKKLQKHIAVQSDGSWLWTSTVHNGGYGITGLYRANPKNSQTPVVHRVLYTLLVGDIPDGMVLMHKDDNKLSVHPDNFDIGTKIDNNEDMCRKHRQHTIFSVEDIKNIADLYDSGDWTQTQISEKYQCSESAINSLLLGKTFSHVKRKTFRTTFRNPAKELRGVETSGAKCTNEMVLEIRAKHAVGDRSFGSLAKEYNINSQTVSNIVNRRSWVHI